MAQRTHNGKPVVRCSQMDQLMGCPGSRRIFERLRIQDEDDRASWEGQWCHYEAAKRMIEINGAMAPEPGLQLPRVPKGYKPPDEGFANWIVDYYVRAVVEETPMDWAMAVEDDIIWEFDKWCLSGHPDVYALDSSATQLNFDDLKSGNNVVDPADQNWQVLSYAALFKMVFDSLRRIRGRIIQPRNKEDVARRTSRLIIDERGVFDGEGLNVNPGLNIDNFVQALDRQVVERLDSWKLATGKQCRWCPADLQCPCLEAERTTVEMELTKEKLEQIKATPDMETLARWGIAKRLLESKLSAAWDLLKARLAEEGGKYVDPQGREFILRDWKGARELSEEGKRAVWEAACNELEEDRAFRTMGISLEQLEREMAEQLDIPYTSKKTASGESVVADRFGKFITRKTGKQLTIVM